MEMKSDDMMMAPQRRARHLQWAVPVEHAQSLPPRLGHGRFGLGQNLTRSPPLQRTGLVWSTTAQMLELRLDALPRPVSPHCTQFAWFSALLELLAQLSNFLHCPVNATTHDAKVPTREGSNEKSQTASTIIIIVVVIIIGV